MSVVREIDAAALDWQELLRPGDRLVVGQANAEPSLLLTTLVEQRAGLGRPELFVGPINGLELQPEHVDHLGFASYCGTGRNRSFTAQGVMEIIPSHFTDIPRQFAEGVQRADVMLLMLAQQDGGYSSGVTNDYTRQAASRARLIVAEVNDQMPLAFGAEWPEELRPHLVIRTSRPLSQVPTPPPSDIDRQIASHVGALVPDGATLELGIGSLPAQVMAELRGHRDLGFHSGVIADAAVDLIEAGVITNARKPIDSGVSVAGLLFGGKKTLDFAHRNPALRLAPASHTHNPMITAQIPAFFAINGAVEVDLSGQVNSETAGGRYIGAVGGLVDFARSAAASRGGRSITMLASTAKGGQVSTITARLDAGNVTLARSDADVIVTEWGVAELRGQSFSERARRLIAIAHPKFREMLERAAAETVAAGE